VPVPLKEKPKTKLVTNSSITVTWNPITGISSGLQAYYGYMVKYRLHGTTGTFRVSGTIDFTDNLTAVVRGLRFDSIYDIRIVPFRRYRGSRTYGQTYPILSAKTRCAGMFGCFIYAFIHLNMIEFIINSNSTIIIIIISNNNNNSSSSSSSSTTNILFNIASRIAIQVIRIATQP